MPDSPPVELASRDEAYQFVARELGLMYDRIERPYLKITPEMAKIVSEGLPQWSMRAEPEGEGIPERPIRPDMGMRELARMAGEHRSAKPLSLRDTYGSDPTPEQRAAHAERVSRWETERDRIRDAMVERVQRGADTSMRTLRDVQATDAVLRRLRDGLITPEAAARQIDAISIEQLARQEMRGAEREGRDRVRGARRAREVLDAAARRGEINEEGADLARWLIDQNPDLYDDLAVTATEAPKGRRGVTAQYDKINRLITLFKGKTNAESAAHEIMHFTEAYLPKDLKEPIRREWRKRLFNEWEKVRDLPVDDPRRQFIESILFYHYQSGGFTESAARRRLRAALQLIVDGAVPESYYEFANSSEMWAVNSSRLMAERKGMGGGVWAKIKNWYKGMVQRVREILGLRSDAPILRAMDAILSGKGLGFTGEYLSEGREMDRTRGIAGGPKTMASMEADAGEGEGEEGPVPKPGRSKKPTSSKLPPVYPMTRETRSTTQLVRDWFGESAGVLRGRAGELGNKITERIKSAIDYGRGIKEQFTDISIGIRKLAENSELVKRLQEPYMHVGWDQTTNSEVPQAYFRYTALLKGWIEPENAAEAEALALLRKLSTKGWNIQADLGANWNYGGIEVPMNRIKEGRSLPNAIMPLLRDLAFDPSHPLRPQAVMEILRATNDMIRRRNEIRRRKMRPDDFIEEPYREYSDVDNFLNRMGEILRSDGEFVSPDGHVAHEFSKDWVIPDLIKIPPGAKYRGGKDGYAPLQQPVLTQRMDGFIDSLAATLGAQIEFGRGELGYDPNRLGPDGKPMGERPKGQFIGASEIDDLREQYVGYYGGKDTGRGQEEGKIFDRAMRTAQGKSFYTSTPRPDIQTPMGVTWAVWDAAKELARTAGLTVSPLLNTVEMVLGPSASENGWFGILKAIAVAPAALADGFSEVFTGKTFTQAGAEAISSGKLNPYAYAYPENIYASGLVGGLKRVNNALRMINSAVNRAQSQQAARMLIEDVGMPEMREKYGANPNDFFNKERMARRLALRAGIDLEEAHNFFNGTMPADRAERILQIARSRTISVLMGENMAAGEVSRFAQLPAVGELFKFYRWHDSFIRRHFKLLQLSMQSGRRGLGRIRAGAPGGVSMTASGAQEMLKTWMFISANAVAAKAIYMAVLASDEEKKREQRAMRRNPEKYWGGMIATQLLAGPVGFIVRTSTDEVIPLGATLPGSVRNIGEGAFDLIWGGAKAVFGDKKGAAQALAGLEQVAPMTKIYTANFTDQGTGRERLRKIQRAEYRDEMKRLKQEEGD